MFVVCEPIAVGFEHVPFNASVLKIVRTTFPDERVRFYGEHAHCDQVRGQLGVEFAASIEWIDINLPGRAATFYQRIRPDFGLVRNLLAMMKREPSCRVLTFTSGNPSLLWALKFYFSLARRSQKVQVVLHGDFSRLRYRSARRNQVNPFYHLGSFRTAVHFACDRRVQHLVLEDAVLDAILDKYPFLRDRYGVLELPLPGDLQEAVEPLAVVSPIKFGYLGRAYESKGFLDFLNVAEEISRRFPGRAEFHAIGSITSQQQKKYASKLGYLGDQPTLETLDRDEYIRRLDDLHFVCLFYNEAYEFTASAVLLDCVERRKPIVGSERSIFVRMKAAFPDLGYLSAPGEYANTIATIISELDSELYERQVATMGAIRESRSPEALARRYNELVQKLELL
jgi:glycosyltransferase involved in cell wall biosynthesis